MKRKISISLFAFIMSLMLCLSFFTEDVKASNGIAIDLSAAVGVLPIESGGTDATTVAEFKYLFGIGSVAEEDVLPIIKGGTGATTAAQARENLNLLDATKVLEKTFPVGAIYISTTNTNPGTLFGGTWAKIENRFLLAAGSSYTAGAQSGSADEIVVSHTHTVSGTAASAGSHYHTVTMYSGGYNGTKGFSDNGSTSSYGGTGDSTSYQSAGSHSHTVSGTAKAAGSSAKGANMPPYVVVNVWKRTA